MTLQPQVVEKTSPFQCSLLHRCPENPGRQGQSGLSGFTHCQREPGINGVKATVSPKGKKPLAGASSSLLSQVQLDSEQHFQGLEERGVLKNAGSLFVHPRSE